ncbi:sulfotransferase [Salinimonas lutimaris]|uniref:sulfotransferase n=1 Tax=Salinimonas lutimaris TaxID=914153 RepID=UPI0015863F01|nr:sulfotransferase [Salinimonas lutimaris]
MNTVFLLSNWYSGATLFSLILDSNPDIVCNGETFPFNKYDKRRYICSCGQHIDECDFYTQTTNYSKETEFHEAWNYDDHVILPRFHENHVLNKYLTSPIRDSFLRNTFAHATGVTKKINNFLQSQIDFFKSALEYSNAKIYIDGTKSIRRAQLFSDFYKQEKVKVIHLVRDPAAFCNSYRKNRDIDENMIDTAITEWNDYIKSVEQLKKRKNVVVLDVRYEDVCNELEATLSRIKDFLGNDISSDFMQEKLKSHILGNRMRASFDYTVTEDLSWKEQLSDDTVSTIKTKTKYFSQRYDYL